MCTLLIVCYYSKIFVEFVVTGWLSILWHRVALGGVVFLNTTNTGPAAIYSILTIPHPNLNIIKLLINSTNIN